MLRNPIVEQAEQRGGSYTPPLGIHFCGADARLSNGKAVWRQLLMGTPPAKKTAQAAADLQRWQACRCMAVGAAGAQEVRLRGRGRPGGVLAGCENPPVRAEARMDDSEGGCSDAEVAGVLSLGKRRGSGNGGGGSGRGGTPGERVLKFELQMYKMRDGEYCIDIQARRALMRCMRRSGQGCERRAVNQGRPPLQMTLQEVLLLQ